ncbi:MAG: hypothetical protein WCT12_23205 [Verrucomicrobiota bacterium]
MFPDCELDWERGRDGYSPSPGALWLSEPLRGAWRPQAAALSGNSG